VKGNFTSLGFIDGSAIYKSFSYQLFEREKSINQDRVSAYYIYARWSRVRNAVYFLRHLAASSPWTSWVIAYIPNVRRNEDFRYEFEIDIDMHAVSPEMPLSWTGWALSVIQWKSAETNKNQYSSQTLPLNSTNFVRVFASDLKRLKAEVLLNHHITITSAVISKPRTVYNSLDRLLDRACHEANIEVLNRIDRAEAAMKLSTKSGKTAPLVLEQSDYNFELRKPSSSMSLERLGAAWIPRLLASELLVGEDHLKEVTVNLWNDATHRLMVEVARARSIFKYTTGERRDADDSEENMIIVPDFGAKDYTFAKSLPMKNITRVEQEYVQEVQEAIEGMLIDNGEVYKYAESMNIFADIEKDDWASRRAASHEFAKTMPHPQASEGKSWWKPVDAILVLADFPDLNVIVYAAAKAIESIWSSECKNVFDPSYRHYDVAARGAALDAQLYVASWQVEENWERCENDDTLPGCWNHQTEYYSEPDYEGGNERDSTGTHKEL
jgi:hypothetical protein